ncbi:PREDICTED: SUPPRESSOR OF ABI3-5 isoform X2 [Nelumbo nucifera]|uniref:SUPPRESSOR OF ABI3-5 isoform X2 n=1 Tax=Nelumbo nucifera TaxID=4432 RepID=A0A1U8A620_NELNU|nr:PREDICTED: SUPPRESSOR OF ABI3-5 isoform X2 [Nelumbo nucifera]
MDPGRYVLQQGWDNNSALEGYGAVHEPDYRVGGSYDGRRFLDEGFSRDSIYPRETFHRDILERDSYPPPPSVAGAWPQPRRRNFDEEYALIRESRRHEKPYLDSFHGIDNLREADNYRELDKYQEVDKFRDNYRSIDTYRDVDGYRDYGYDRPFRFGGRDRDDFPIDDYDFRHRSSHPSREESRERDYDYGRYSYDSDYERSSRRDSSWRRRDSRDRDRDKRGLSRERDQSPHRRHERSRSRGRDERPRSRSPRGRSHGRSHREDSYDDSRHERNEKRRDHDEKRHHEHSSVAPSATVVVKGLSQKTTEEDLYQILAEWGPLRHVRVIKERNSGISRGFAFIDFPSVGDARKMMDGIGDDGLVVDGRKLFFEYSKPTGGAGGPYGQDGAARSSYGNHRSAAPPSDWMCTMCGCVNFARRTSCFQCNEARADDAPAADVGSSNPATLGKKGPEAGPTHVLVVRGLDENADEEMLRYEFSKHAPIKDLRLVRDKFTHVSRGFAFVHFHSVEDATKALEAANGMTLEKNGQVLRVAYAKSIHGPGSGTSGASSSLAAAAIEAATFAQQYDAVGWAPKEYNPDDKQSGSGQEKSGVDNAVHKDGSAPQSGFVWDEASGYYYDAASGFYYDGNTGLYYDGNNGTWYSYDHQTQQYVPCGDQNDNKTADKATSEASKTSDSTSKGKVVISAPAATIKSSEKASLPDAVQAAAAAALAAEKKEKEKMKEIRLASKSSILASKKKMTNVLTMWKQRNHEGQAARVVLDDSQPLASTDDRSSAAGVSGKGKFRTDSVSVKENVTTASAAAARGNSNASTTPILGQTVVESQIKPQPVSNSLGGTLMGVIRGSGRGIVKSDTIYSGSSTGASTLTAVSSSGEALSAANSDGPMTVTPFRTDASALGSYVSPVAAGSGKRRFSEMPQQPVSSHREQPHTTYRDRAAERRNLYGSSSSSIGDDISDLGLGDSNRDLAYRKGSDVGTMPFPPGVGGRGASDVNVQSYEVITADRAIDESNVGNRMLRSMGWQEGLGLGKDGSGIIEPVQAQAVEDRAGLGSRQQKKLDPSLEVQAGDSYRILVQKKAIARFSEMS